MLPGLRRRGFNFADIVLYFAIALKHVRLMVLLMSFSLCLGLMYYVYAKPVFFARSLIQVHTITRTIDVEKIQNENSDREILMRLVAPHIIQRTAKKLGIPDNPRIIYSKYLRTPPVPRFNSERNIEVDISTYSGPLARIWTETMLLEFLKDREEKRTTYVNRTIEGYTREMKEVMQKMAEALDTKYEAQGGRKAALKAKLDELQELPKELSKAKRRLEQLDRIKSTLSNTNQSVVDRLALVVAIQKESLLRAGDIVPNMESSGNGDDKASSGTSLVVVPNMLNLPSDRPWEELEKRRSKLLVDLAEADKTYRSGHPVMVALQKRLDETNRELESDLDTALNNYKLEYDTVKERLVTLEKKKPEYDTAFKEYDRFLNDTRMAGAGNLNWEAIYAAMKQKLEVIDFGADKERVHLQYMNHLDLRDQIPVSPNRFKILLFALILGAVLSIGIPFLIEFLDHTVTNVEEMEQNHRLRGLGIVPRMEASQLPGYPSIDARAQPDRQLLENFRVIRTNLLSMGAVTRNPQAIVIASAMPEEGKTVVSYNLAQSFAQMGEKTILIDADLRRGRLHRVFNYRSAPGLSNILVQNLDWRDVVRPTDKENLVLLTCGKHLDGATELIGSPAFEKLLQEFRGEFKRIIIDTPPVLGLSETAMMQRLVDGVVLVVWCGRTPARYVKSAVEILQANHANFYGFVLNRLDLNVTSNYYNYYNYYYYSYHYYKSYKALENPPPATPVEKG